jgi:hypothetical protein
MEHPMTRDQLADRLTHLDPGARLTVEENTLAPLFGADRLTADVIQVIETFALEHRCRFSLHDHERAVPCFEKDDLF